MVRRKVGRPRSLDGRVNDSDGNEVPYMRLDSYGNYHVRWKDEKGWHKKNLSRDKELAFQKYEVWLAEFRGEETVTATKPSYLKSLAAAAQIRLTEHFSQQLEEKHLDAPSFVANIIDSIFIDNVDIPISVCLEMSGEFIRKGSAKNIRKAASLMKIPQIEYITTLKKPEPPLSLSQIKNIYFNQDKFKGHLETKQISELRETANAWDRFCNIIKIKDIREMEFELAEKYYSDLYGEFKAQGKYKSNSPKSTTWFNHNIERVFRIINGGINGTYGSKSTELEDFKKICKKAIKRQIPVTNAYARKIKREEFHKLLDVSNIEERTMWLLSMNSAFYTVDIANLPLSSFDWEEKTIVFRRGKMEERGGGHRAAVLWDITIEAIKEYQKCYPHNGKTLFFNRKDKFPYVRARVATKFRKCRNKAKISSEVTHAHFRDSVRSIGSSISNQMSVDAVMGQNPKGNRGNYVDPEEYPLIAKECCEAVYDFYFN